MQIDEEFLNEVGLAEMPEDEKRAFMEHAEEELEVRVGQGIGDLLTEEQLDEFDSIDDEEKAALWLKENAPDYQSVVRKVFTAFKDELVENQAKILGY